jgi:hypothetical protein
MPFISVPKPVLSRRHAMMGFPALAAAGMMAPSLAAATEKRANFDPMSPEDNLKYYIKLHYSLIKEPIHSYFGGLVFAQMQDQPAKLLFDLAGYGQGWVEPQPDGTYHLAWKEIGFLRDPVTLKILDTWHNPYIDEDVTVRHIGNPAANSVIAAHPTDDVMKNWATGAVTKEPQNYRNLADPEALILPWQTIGDSTSVWQDSRLAMKHNLDPKVWVRESSGERIAIGEFMQVVARTNELFDDKRNSVPYTGAWARIASWHPWMLMGQRQGNLFYRCSLNKLTGPEQLPKDLLAAIKARSPEYLETPTEWGPRFSTWKDFFAKNKPKPFPNK